MRRLSIAFALSTLLLVLSSAAQQKATTAGNPANRPKSGVGIDTVVNCANAKNSYIPVFTSAAPPNITICDSAIFQSSGNIGIGTTTPAATLDVNGAVNAATSFDLGGSAFAFGTLSNANAFLGFSGNSTMTGVNNTATGVDALQNNISGYQNTASGYGALQYNTTGFLNTATGVGALQVNTIGQQNTATGTGALQFNLTGNGNTATGTGALHLNTEGGNNTAEGLKALVTNTTGFNNTASGYGALASNTTGSYNTAPGMLALYYNVTGNENTALGYGAGPDINSPNLTNATAIGYQAVVSQSNALVLGSPGVNVGIGTATPAYVFTIAQGAGVAWSDGWMVYSSRRWKTNIQTLHGALGKVEQLRGVSYDLQANGKHEVGVIAEEVGAVVPEVVTWDKNGKDAEGVDYSRLTALLIEATKEQQKLIQAQQEQITRLVSQMKTVQTSLKASRRDGSEVHTVKAQLGTVRQ